VQEKQRPPPPVSIPHPSIPPTFSSPSPPPISPSVRYSSAHWTQTTSYVPGAGFQACRPDWTKARGFPARRPPSAATAAARRLLAASNRWADGSTRSTAAKKRSSRSLDTRPTPAPQSAAVRAACFPPPAAAPASSLPGPNTFLRKASLCWTSATLTASACPPRTPSSVAGWASQYSTAFAYQPPSRSASTSRHSSAGDA